MTPAERIAGIRARLAAAPTLPPKCHICGRAMVVGEIDFAATIIDATAALAAKGATDGR